MDNNIVKIFEDMLDINLRSVIISNSMDKDVISKIKIRPILLKEQLYFQVSKYIGTKIYHENYQKEAIIEMLPEWFEGLFRQAELTSKVGQAIVLISKKGKATVKFKKSKEAMGKELIQKEDQKKRPSLANLQHNKKKNYILEEGIPLPILIDLGVMTADGAIVKAKSDKFRQINRFLEYIEDILEYLDINKELNILDFGCGKSYLTFAMYYYLKVIKSYRVNIIGLDLKADVIEHCNKLAKKYGYVGLEFFQGDIASYRGSRAVDMVVTLHACDTATDYALYHAVSWNAKIILSVPCCQHELNKQMNNEILKPILKYGIVKERMSALITDALRAELLELKGYRVQLLEFIDMEHTPKNILIRAVKRENNSVVPRDKENNYQELVHFLNVNPCLQRLFEEQEAGEGN